VEVDATWYAVPRRATVERWHKVTPRGFLFAAKVPQSITHEKMLSDCGPEVAQFLKAMEPLGEKLGPLLLQFPYAFGPEHFDRLDEFLESLPKDRRWAVEVRHRGWIGEPFFEMLERHGAAHVWLDLFTMPRLDRVTADFAYVRWIGNRKQIEKRTRTWDRLIVDRTEELTWWAPRVKRELRRKVPVYAFFNNHYAGFAPGSVEMFEKILEAAGAT
jgi:uncharacterized protein YecE (DUF72 family)